MRLGCANRSDDIKQHSDRPVFALILRQLLQRLQQEEADALHEPVKLKDLVKLDKTRWNSCYAGFARAVELQGHLDSYVELKIDENCHAVVTAR
jgi:hypothetical protein